MSTCEFALWWMAQNNCDDKSTLVQAVDCLQITKLFEDNLSMHPFPSDYK